MWFGIRSSWRSLRLLEEEPLFVVAALVDYLGDYLEANAFR